MKRRLLFPTIFTHLQKREATIILGARQVGKTTLLKQLMDEWVKSENFSFFISLEDPDFLGQINIHPDNVFKILNIFPDEKKKITLFIDEIQYLKNPTLFLKYIIDTYDKRVKIIATGSSAFYMDQKFTDSLAGRKRIFDLFTLSFEEFLSFRGEIDLLKEFLKVRENNNLHSRSLRKIQILFEEYLIYGGYPAVVIEESPDEKKLILKELATSFLKRDILESGIIESFKFYDLIRILSLQIGGCLNIHRISRDIRLSHATTELYINILRKCFHIQLIPPFFTNISKEIGKMPKLYFHDLGFRNVLLNSFNPLSERQDKGALVENYVFTRLRFKYGEDVIRYWRTSEGHEVDFIVRGGVDNEQAIEVKFSDTETAISKYKLFKNNYPEFNFRFLCFNTEKPERSMILF